MARKILKRIQTKKFTQYWESIPKLNNISSHFENKPSITDNNPRTVETYSYKHLLDFDLEKHLFFNENNHLKEEKREWTQNLYEHLPSQKILCNLIVKRKYLKFNQFLKIYCHCQFKECQLKHIIYCNNLQNQTLTFSVSVNGNYDESKHAGKKCGYT